jgi:hypothetical protein
MSAISVQLTVDATGQVIDDFADLARPAGVLLARVDALAVDAGLLLAAVLVATTAGNCKT